TAFLTYPLIEGAGTSSGRFEGEVLPGAGATYAFSPAITRAGFATGKFTFELPEMQQYAANSFGRAASPMVAQSDAQGVLQFKNLCGAICLQLTGKASISTITLRTATEQVAGTASVAMNYTDAPVLTLEPNSVKKVIELQGVNKTLSETTPTSFYFMVPAGTYAAGLKFVVLNQADEQIAEFTTVKPVIVERSRVAKLAPLVVAHFPDVAFRTKLVAMGFEPTANGKDIDVDNPDNLALFTSKKELSVQALEITDLTGIQYFSELTKLVCGANKLTTLNLSNNLKLTALQCDDNQLTTLDLTANTALTFMSCSQNYIAKLDLSANKNLNFVDCSSNRLIALNVSQNKSLTELSCQANQLPTLDVSANAQLEALYCYLNRLTTLDIRRLSALKTLYGGNQGTAAAPLTLILRMTRAQDAAGVVASGLQNKRITRQVE
ncbi:MAG: hypothetical protein RR522_01185, partial [Alistipes sp.]